ncbi:cysteine desulfurase [Hellea sp.]|nr:cysteine desulfurase family protein [Hellea sp.]MDA8888305.1 cysteine desulfurase [Hellea sp.]MDB4845144.1 cysteine desulfurase [Hellea sp.]MDC0422066.1 cysteine desulfurase [Hellea sp.]MDC0650763.1 cysteine desulfurase [Hellea sp.]MDC1062499.1 cysteine desulfurase family protein [Hellea sp.]
MTRVYLDNNASCPIRPEVIAAVTDVMHLNGNSSAQHSDGRKAQAMISKAREIIGLEMGVCSQDIIFTSSGTEALNTAIFAAHNAGCKKMLFSNADHAATYKAAVNWGYSHDFIPTDVNGVTDTVYLKEILKNWNSSDGRPFVSVSAANGETGVLQPVDTIVDIVHQYNGLVLVDAVQAFGKIPMTFNADYIAISAHKIGGPQGVGALYACPNTPFSPLLCGGGQERRMRSGTMNLAGIHGFGVAASMMNNLDFTKKLRDSFEMRLKIVESDLNIFGANVDRLPNTSFISSPDLNAMTMMMALDLAGISVSTGSACSSGKSNENRIIKSMGLSDSAPKGAIRVSFGYKSMSKDVDQILSAWSSIRNRTEVTNG